MLDGVSFVNGPMVRYKGYKQTEIFLNWSGEIFDSLLQAIFDHLNLSIDLPPIELFLGIILHFIYFWDHHVLLRR